MQIFWSQLLILEHFSNWLNMTQLTMNRWSVDFRYCHFFHTGISADNDNEYEFRELNSFWDTIFIRFWAPTILIEFAGFFFFSSIISTVWKVISLIPLTVSFCVCVFLSWLRNSCQLSIWNNWEHFLCFWCPFRFIALSISSEQWILFAFAVTILNNSPKLIPLMIASNSTIRSTNHFQQFKKYEPFYFHEKLFEISFAEILCSAIDCFSITIETK